MSFGQSLYADGELRMRLLQSFDQLFVTRNASPRNEQLTCSVTCNATSSNRQSVLTAKDNTLALARRQRRGARVWRLLVLNTVISTYNASAAL
jgi:hypothetical protein